MIEVQNLKYVAALATTSATAGATLTSGVIDMQGYDYASIVISGTTANAATNSPTVLALQESDTTAATSFSNVTAFQGGSGFSIPNSPTSTNNEPYAVFNVDARARKRYLQVVISPQTTQSYSVLALLARPQTFPTTATQQNVSGIVVTG